MSDSDKAKTASDEAKVTPPGAPEKPRIVKKVQRAGRTGG